MGRFLKMEPRLLFRLVLQPREHGAFVALYVKIETRSVDSRTRRFNRLPPPRVRCDFIRRLPPWELHTGEPAPQTLWPRGTEVSMRNDRRFIF